MTVPSAIDIPSRPATTPTDEKRSEPMRRLVRLLARQAAAEYAAELRTRDELA